MDYKIQNSQNAWMKLKSIILLRRVEEWNTLAEELVNEELSSLELSKPDMYQIDTKYSEIKENNLDSDDTELYHIPRNIATNTIDSDSTEPYEIEKKNWYYYLQNRYHTITI